MDVIKNMDVIKSELDNFECKYAKIIEIPNQKTITI